MAVTKTRFGGRYERWSEASGANSALTVSVAPGVPFRFLYATVKYSAAPTQTGVTAVLNSGVGAAYDTTLSTGTANAQSTLAVPVVGGIECNSDDAVDVTAPAAGGSITGQIVAVVELL